MKEPRLAGAILGIDGTKALVTLLVNSKTPWMATLHLTVESQGDRGCCVKQFPPMLLEIQWLRLNQQGPSALGRGLLRCHNGSMVGLFLS